MQTSEPGITFLERHEGVVLKAYRDPVGILTIGAGLTKASGVIDPKPGMVITRAEASRLLALSLRSNYEPAVARALPGVSQFAFDGAVSFHFNTGGIGRASWVKAFRQGDLTDAKRRIKLWNKGGGRVLPGLVRRRAEEFDLIAFGDYSSGAVEVAHAATQAKIVVALQNDELAEVRTALRHLGYDPGAMPVRIDVKAIRAFQKDHDLTVDGIVGRATLSTLQRMIDARAKAKTTAVTTTGGAAGAAGGSAADVLPLEQAFYAGGGVLVIGLMVAAYVAWRYRDAVAVKVQSRFPKLAAKLRGL